MPHRRRELCAAIAISLVLVPALRAQKTPEVPTRSQLQAGADTNDTRAHLLRPRQSGQRTRVVRAGASGRSLVLSRALEARAAPAHEGRHDERALELDLAAQLQPNNVAVRCAYAMALVKVRGDADAAAQLKAAIAADPYYAAPHLLLARIADVEEYTDDAVSEYQRFTGLAVRSAPELSFVKGRLAALTTVVATSPSKP